ncbi:TetR/AcrR family transcriptional regulator [Mycolicibacterium aichiense]|uniref:TetR/AcrR family transcriptional regulator n=1 Tax=Mycolicibacterium aichiense TaxID=1799 RepID=UPI003D672644
MVRRRAASPRQGAALTGGRATPVPLTARGRRTRAAILDAAALLIYQRGVRATSLDDVLAVAGCGKSQLYHYFDDKAELVGAVIDRQLEIVLAAQPGLTHIDSWATLDAWMAGIVEMHSAPGGPFACPLGKLAAELMDDEVFRPRVDAAFGRWMGLLADGLRTMQERGALRADAEPDRLAANVIAALQGAMLVGRVRGDITAMRDAIDVARMQLRQWCPATVDREPPTR